MIGAFRAGTLREFWLFWIFHNPMLFSMRLCQLLVRRTETACRPFPARRVRQPGHLSERLRPALRIYRQFIELCLLAEGVAVQTCRLAQILITPASSTFVLRRLSDSRRDASKRYFPHPRRY